MIYRKGFLVSKSFALANAQAQNIYGPLEAGYVLNLKTLADTLDNIANIPEEDLYKQFRTDNLPMQTQAIKSTFYHYNIYVPNIPSIGPVLLVNLQHIEQMNYTLSDIKKPEFVTMIADITEAVYESLNVSMEFHNGTSSNVAVIDMDEEYVSLIT